MIGRQNIISGPRAATPAPTPARTNDPRRYTIALKPGLRLLNTNHRPHHHERARITATLRAAATVAVTADRALTAALCAAKPGPLLQRAHVLAVLHPPKNGRRDPANWYPSFKAAVDGALVDTGLIEDDDHTHLLGPDMRLGPKVTGGQLVLHITELAPGEDWPELPAAVTR